MNTRRPGPWTYRAYPSDKPAEELGELASFVEIWRRKSSPPGVFPAWQDFDLMDLQGWWGQMSLAEMHVDPFNLRWALWGTRITDWWGVDYTNKFISDIPEIQTVWQMYERPYLEKLTGERLIGYVSGTLSPQARKFYHICGVDLPLEKNGVVTHVMSAYRLCDDGQSFVPPGTPVFEI